MSECTWINNENCEYDENRSCELCLKGKLIQSIRNVEASIDNLVGTQI